MAETLVSPGVLARESDQSQITAQPIQAGAAIIGPTVLGKVNIPTLVTTYSEYLANFGSTFTSASDEYSFLTSISAYNYFQNGGDSLLVGRVTNGTYTAASSSTIITGSGGPTSGLSPFVLSTLSMPVISTRTLSMTLVLFTILARSSLCVYVYVKLCIAIIILLMEAPLRLDHLVG